MIDLDYPLVYVGPYVECWTEAAVRTAGCGTPGCSYARGGLEGRRLCPSCLGRSQGRLRPGLSREALAALNDTLQPVELQRTGDYVCLTPNVHRDPPRCFEFPAADDAERCEPIDPETASAEMSWLVRSFAGELEALRRIYGPGRVRVRWGILRYAI